MNREFLIGGALAAGILGYVAYKRRKFFQHRGPVRVPPIGPTEQPTPPPPTTIPAGQSDPVPIPNVPPPPPIQPEPVVISTHQAYLTAAIVAKIGSPEHNIVTPDLVKAEAMKRVDRIRINIESCPGAPKLIGNPEISVQKEGSFFGTATYYCSVKWLGSWQDEFLRVNTVDCIKRSLLSMFPDADQYVTSISINKE